MTGKYSKTVKGISATNTYFMEMPTAELDAARRSMAIVSVDLHTREPYIGSGVVANRNGRRYLVVASHSIGEIAYGRNSPHKVYLPGKAIHLAELEMKYSVPIAQSLSLPVRDIVIFDFPFDSIGSVEIGDIPREPIVALSMGFPVDAMDMWKSNRLPVARAGLAYLSRRAVSSFSPYGEIDLDRFVDKITAEVLTAGGSSGGGLFDQEGKLLGICRGFKTGNREFGKFYAAKPLFEALEL